MKSKFLGHSANDLFWFILPLVMPSLLVRYELSFAQAGGILTTYLMVTAVFSFTVGKLADRISRKKLLGYGFIVAAAGLASSGFAPNLGVFLALISVTAVGVSTFHPVMYAVLDDLNHKNRGRIMGYYESFGTGAILLMFLINGYLMGFIGVRGILILTAGPALVMGLTYLFTDVIPDSVKAQSSRKDSEQAEKKDILRFVLFLLSVILRVFSVTAVLNFLPTIFVSFMGYSESSAAYASAFFFGGGLLGSLIAGRLADRFNSFTILLGGTLLIIPSLFLFYLEIPPAVYPVVVALFGAFGSGCIINQNLLMSRMGRHLGSGEIFGILMGVMTVTSSFSPVLFGLTIDTAGYKPALLMFTAPLILSILLLMYLKRDSSEEGNLTPALQEEGWYETGKG
ncbi:MAG: MFS transporter [Spirochaetales bacterium]|nr:MFS transporter [Spirochaetales bacterium]